MEQTTIQTVAEPAKGLVRGTPEGDQLVRVRCMTRVRFGPSPALEKMYEIGECLTIPKWRYTSYHNPPKVRNMKGELVAGARGAFEPEAWSQPADDNVAKHPEQVSFLLDENAQLREKLAKLEAASQVEPLIVPDASGKPGKKKGKEEEI